MATTSATRVVTGKVRLSYCHLFEAWSNRDDIAPNFSCVLLIPKSDKATIKKLRDAEAAAAEAGKSKFGGRVPASLKSIIHDGDEEGDLERNPEYAGHLYMNVSSKTRPGIVDARVQPIIDPTEVYSGCYARVEINAYAYNTAGNKGISFGLNHVQKMADGDFLGGRTRPEDAFDPIEEEEGESSLI